MITEYFEATGDLRFLDDAQRERVRARMREIVSQSLTHTSVDAGLGPIEALPPGERGAIRAAIAIYRLTR